MWHKTLLLEDEALGSRWTDACPNGCDEVAKNGSWDLGGVHKSTMSTIEERSHSHEGGGLGRATWMAKGLEAVPWNG